MLMGLSDTRKEKRGKNMACHYPLKGYQFGTTINNKPNYKITSYDTILYDENGQPREYIEVPCGRCAGCRLEYSRVWADRCMAEATLHETSWFVTLTYNEEHVPYSEKVIDLGTGELIYKTLCKRDVQLFMKRLRKNYQFNNKIRFYLAGEYGSDTARPHYHAILFGLKLPDIQFYKRTPLGFNLYTSEFLNSVWSDDLGQIGHVIVAEVTWETCAYTARYIMKKQNGDASEWWKENGVQQEFTLMSRKPGIAKEFYEKNKLDFLRYRGTDISTLRGGRKIKNIKYFDKFLDIEYPQERSERKEVVKKRMEVIKQKKLENTSRSYLEMLNDDEEIMQRLLKKLPRKEI
jgi:hypothetical protein